MTDLERVVDLSMRLGHRYLADYAAAKSRHDFTQRQLMSCLILKAYWKTTYRGVLDILASSDSLRSILGLERKLPHYTTLQKFALRSDVASIASSILGYMGESASKSPAQIEAAIDATGLESSVASAHFISRSGRSRRRYVKVSASVICGCLLPVGLVVDWGPSNDKVHAAALLEQTLAHIQPSLLYADAGYDAEWIHQRAKADAVKSLIKPVRHRKDGTLGGALRSQMTPEYLKAGGYGRRWHVESFFSALKRKVGSTLASRNPKAILTEATLKVLAYAIHR